MLSSYSLATTLAVFITPFGIVVGTDSKGVNSAQVCAPYISDQIISKKASVLANGFVVAVAGMADVFGVDLENGVVIKFSVMEVVDKINRQVTPHTTMRELIKIIGSETDTFMPYIASRTMEKGKTDTAVMDQMLIAGYDKGAPFVYSITFTVHWVNRTMSADIKLEQPPKGRDFDLVFYSVRTVADEITKPGSRARLYVMQKAPLEMSMLFADQPVNPRQAETIVKTMIEAQAILTPQYVGPPIKILVIPKPK